VDDGMKRELAQFLCAAKIQEPRTKSQHNREQWRQSLLRRLDPLWDIREKIDKYVAENGARCLICGSSSIEGNAVEIDCGQALQNISCLDCHSSWTDVYVLSNADEIDVPSDVASG
jgi:hypothetical protein